MTRYSGHPGRLWLAIAFLIATLALALMPSSSRAFGFDDVAERAQKLAASAYQDNDKKIPDALKHLDYDQYRDIRFRPDKALWRERKLPFEVMFFHVGGFFTAPVHINEIDDKGATLFVLIARHSTTVRSPG